MTLMEMFVQQPLVADGWSNDQSGPHSTVLLVAQDTVSARAGQMPIANKSRQGMERRWLVFMQCWIWIFKPARTTRAVGYF